MVMRSFLENKIIFEDLDNMYSYYRNSWIKLKNKSILITGAYGMLPSYIVYFLIYLNEIYDYNINIIAVGRDVKKAEERFSIYLNKDWFTFLQQDVSEQIIYDKNIDYIIHGASPASSSHYSNNPINVIKSNIFGTFSTLELAVLKSAEGYLFFSSADIYGLNNNKYICETDTASGIDTLDIRSCYCESKRMGENICICYHHQYKVPIKIARLGHTFGPTLDLNDERVFSQFISDVVNNRDISIKSDGKSIRTFCYIADAAAGLLKILVEGDGAYNVSNKYSRISIKDLAQMLISLYPEKNIRIRYIQREENDSYIESPNKFSPIFNTEKLESLGWRCHYSLQDMFSRTVSSLVQNK